MLYFLISQVVRSCRRNDRTLKKNMHFYMQNPARGKCLYFRLDSLIPEANRKPSLIQHQADIFLRCCANSQDETRPSLCPVCHRLPTGLCLAFSIPRLDHLFSLFPPECVINRSCVSYYRLSRSLPTMQNNQTKHTLTPTALYVPLAFSVALATAILLLMLMKNPS